MRAYRFLRSSVTALPRSASWSGTLAVAAVLAVGCGSSTKDTGSVSEGVVAIPLECRGFPMENLKYSPGGTVLPNTCKPFDPTTNNPYAVRCVDVNSSYKTRYAGDEYCILPPDPDKGVQIGIHPQGTSYWKEMWAGDISGYSNSALTAEYEVAPNQEIEQTYRSNMNNPEAHWYYRIESRMRDGSHHLASYKTTTHGDEGWSPVDGSVTPAGADAGFLWNAQRVDASRPVSTLAVPDEDQGLGTPLAAEQSILLDVHHINERPDPILREVWINVWWAEGAVTHPVEDRPLVAPVSVPPNAVTVLSNNFAPTKETRVLSLFGHRHLWTKRFDAWVHRANGTDEPVYDSFDWLEVPTYSFDSLTTNPVADVPASQDGAASGILLMEPGDVLNFECHVDTTAEHAQQLHLPVPTETLVFGNKAIAAEMCILYSQTITTGGVGDN